MARRYPKTLPQERCGRYSEFENVSIVHPLPESLLVLGKSTVFLFNDSQIVSFPSFILALSRAVLRSFQKDESFIEDINMMLNTADIPNLFPSDERAEICDKMQTVARLANRKIESTPMALYNFFIERVRSALHIVLAFSPVGDAFRNRLRMFPSLINCCTIDWFTSWPEDALEMVAKKFLEEVELEDEIRANCVVRTALETFVGFFSPISVDDVQNIP